MSETTELAPAETATPAATEKPKRRIWPLLAWGAVAAVIVMAGTVAALGTTGALIAGGCTAGAVAGGAVLWRLPQLRKHFARPRGASKMRSVQSRTRRMSLGGGRKGKPLGLGLGSGRKGGKLLPGGGKGRAAGKGLLGKGRSGKAAAGKGRAGRSLLGRARSAAGRLLPGRAGRKARAGSGATGGRQRGPVRRAIRRLLPGPGGRSSKRADAKKKASPARKAAGIAGAAALLPFAGGKKLRAWVRKRRRKNAPPASEDKPAARTPDEPAAPDPPPPRQPGLPLAPSHADHPRTRRHPVSNQLGDTAEAIQQGIGGFEPENVEDLGAFLQALPAVYEALASGLNRVADRFGDEYPLHPAVVEHIRELGSHAAGQHEYAAEAHHVFTTTHQDDLERLENPRPGEEFMDVGNQ